MGITKPRLERKALPQTRGQEGSRRQEGWTGWSACYGSFQNRRPRNAAPNPQRQLTKPSTLDQWVQAYDLSVPGY
jgi:hypothetical protein